MKITNRSVCRLSLVAAIVILVTSGPAVAADDPIVDVAFDTIAAGTDFVPGADEIDMEGDVIITGTAEAMSFQTATGEMLVDPGVTETAALTFGKRSVYIVKASWGGGYMEGTRAWFVLTHNDLNSITGQPAIFEIGMTQGSAHHSDTLELEQDASLGWSQLRLSCTRSVGTDSRYCRWGVTRLSYK